MKAEAEILVDSLEVVENPVGEGFIANIDVETVTPIFGQYAKTKEDAIDSLKKALGEAGWDDEYIDHIIEEATQR